MSARHANRAYVYAIAYAAFLVLVLLPIWRVSHPPLEDYPNHLARMYIINHAEEAPINQYYEIRWAAIPNLAMDLVVPFLSRLFPLDVAGKLFIALTFVLLTAGSLVLSKAVFGKVSPFAFASFLLLYNKSLEAGFLNFLFSCGLALLAIALWIGLSGRDAWQRCVSGILAAPLLFFCHLYGLAIYAFFTLAYELWHGTKNPLAASSWLRTYVNRASIWLPQFVLPVVLFGFFSPLASQVPDLLLDLKHFRSWILIQGLFSFKLAQFSNILRGHDLRVNMIVALCLGSLFLHAVIREHNSFPIYLWAPIGFAIGLYFLLPSMMLGGANVDWRLLIPVAFVALSGIPYDSRSNLAPYGMLGLFGLLLLIQVGSVSKQWREGERLYSDYKAVAQAIPTGARLFPYRFCGQKRFDDYLMSVQPLVSFAVIDRQALVPSLFARESQQVLRLRGDYRRDWQIYYYSADDIDWDYIAAHYDYALNLDRDFGRFANCAPPAGWATVTSVGRLTLLEPLTNRRAEPSRPTPYR